MKKNFLPVSLLLFLGWSFLSNTMKDPNNPPVGKTGAPGENTCAQSNCHHGGSFTGEVSISGIPDTIVANQTYMITLKNTSDASRAGFELTCLDNSNIKCGVLTSGSGVSIGSGGGRQYARQSSPRNLSNGSTSWTFSWKAPATINGDTATFYFVSLCANGNGEKDGDNVVMNSKTVVLPSAVATVEAGKEELIEYFQEVVSDRLELRLRQAVSAEISIFDLNGKLVQKGKLTQNNTLNVSHLQAGIYVANIKIQGKTTVNKFVKI